MKRFWALFAGQQLPNSAAALARAALGADAARASANYFVATAMRTDDVHEHVPECFLDTIGVTAAVAQHLRLAVVRRMARDHVDQFFFAGPRQIRYRPVQRLLFHFPNLFQR